MRLLLLAVLSVVCADPRAVDEACVNEWGEIAKPRPRAVREVILPKHFGADDHARLEHLIVTMFRRNEPFVVRQALMPGERWDPCAVQGPLSLVGHRNVSVRVGERTREGPAHFARGPTQEERQVLMRDFVRRACGGGDAGGGESAAGHSGSVEGGEEGGGETDELVYYLAQTDIAKELPELLPLLAAEVRGSGFLTAALEWAGDPLPGSEALLHPNASAQALESGGAPPHAATVAAPFTLYLNGAGATRSTFHYDAFENLICIAGGGSGGDGGSGDGSGGGGGSGGGDGGGSSGGGGGGGSVSKRFTLFDPLTSSALLYADGRTGNTSPVLHDDTDPDGWEEKWPLAKYATPSEVALAPGDCAYIPIYWFHYVETSDSPAVALNWWRKAEEGKKDVLGRLLCGSRHTKAAMTCGS